MGTRVVVTSLVRCAGLTEPSGFLRIIDLDTERVLVTHVVPESAARHRDANPRGGRRGAKGIGIHGDRLVIANSDRVFVLDRTWRLCDEITHPWIAGIHDILCEADGIWVTATDCDLLAQVGWDGRLEAVWCWRNDPDLVRELRFRAIPAFAGQLDYRDPQIAHTGVHNIVHLNSVARGAEGLLLSFGRITTSGAITRARVKGAGASLLSRVNMGPAAVSAVRQRRARRIDSQGQWPVEACGASAGAIVLLRDAALESRRGAVLLQTPARAGVPNHNVVQKGSCLVYNNSNRGRLESHDRVTGEDHGVAIPGAPSFPRGLAWLGSGVFVVGSQRPAAIHLVDLESEVVTRSISLGGHENESVYGIAVLPNHFDDPGERLFR